MLIGSPQMIKITSCSQPNILIENKRIQQVNQSKSLGITIAQHLSWKHNTENICKKITSGISALRHVIPFIAEKEPLIPIYNAIVRPYFSLRSRRYSWAQGEKLEIPPAQKLIILSSAHRAHGSAHINCLL